MIWIDAWEIGLMAPRGTPSLWPFHILTDLGKDAYVLCLLFTTLIITALLVPRSRDPTRARLLGFAARAGYLFLAVLVPVLIAEILKWGIGRGRPFVGGKANAFNFVPFAGSEAYFSFPSAHVVTAFALGCAVAAIWPRARVAAFAYAFYRLYLKPAPCAPDAACVSPTTRRNQRIAFWATLVAAKALILFPIVYGHFA